MPSSKSIKEVTSSLKDVNKMYDKLSKWRGVFASLESKVTPYTNVLKSYNDEKYGVTIRKKIEKLKKYVSEGKISNAEKARQSVLNDVEKKMASMMKKIQKYTAKLDELSMKALESKVTKSKKKSSSSAEKPKKKKTEKKKKSSDDSSEVKRGRPKKAAMDDSMSESSEVKRGRPKKAAATEKKTGVRGRKRGQQGGYYYNESDSFWATGGNGGDFWGIGGADDLSASSLFSNEDDF